MVMGLLFHPPSDKMSVNVCPGHVAYHFVAGDILILAHIPVQRLMRQFEMPDRSLYSIEDIKKAYEKTGDHATTRNIITRYSTNPDDIRDIALDGLDLSCASHILELGCGYGAFTGKLAGRLHEEAEITGIDMVAENGPPFSATVAAIGYKCVFVRGNADLIKKMRTSHFDLIIASYSLYFFPDLVGDVSRILEPGGIFIAITHSRRSLEEVLQFIPKSLANMGLASPEETRLARLFRAFSMENGQAHLAPFFRRVDVIIYENRLMFPKEDFGDCVDYLNKKDSLLFKDIEERYPHQREAIKSHFYDDLRLYAERKGGLSITKDDAVFRCFEPLAALPRR
jgi:SAM-dependent methyltransferase